MIFRKTIFLVILFCVVLSIACFDQNNSKNSISGQIKNAKVKEAILILEEDVNRKKKRVVGKISIDEKGNFSADFSDLEPHIYTLAFGEKNKILLAINKGQKLNIAADAKDFSNIKIDGSEDTQKLLDYEKFRKESLERLVKSVRKEIKELKKENNPQNAEKIKKLEKAEIANYDKHRDELTDCVKNKMGTSIAVYATSLRWDGGKHIPFLESLASNFEKEHPNLSITKKIKEKVGILKNTSIGGKVSEIKMPDKDGKEIALSEIKGKYILIDFWASWCGPCRREGKMISNLHEKYKEKGFEIYGVSLDTEKDLWLKAIEKDGRNWTNVTTLQGFETPVTFDYAVTALPAKFIIDSEGKIVAKNLHGEELKEKIEGLFIE